MSDFPERIAYVDDDKGLCKIAKDVLEAINPDILFITCETSQEFLSRLSELNPELLILDATMDEMNGPDTIAAMREKEGGADFPVIFLSKKQELVMQDEYKALGVIGIIHKPFDPTDLGDLIQEIWNVYVEEKAAA